MSLSPELRRLVELLARSAYERRRDRPDLPEQGGVGCLGRESAGDHARKLQKRVDAITAAQKLPPLSDPLTLMAAAEVVLSAPTGTPVDPQ